MSQWEEIEYERLTPDDARIVAFASAANRVYGNGQCLVFAFRARDPQAFDAALRTELWGLEHLLGAFLKNPSVFGELTPVRVSEAEPCPPDFHTMGPLQLEGALADSLVWGGAYTGGVPVEAARDIGRDFVVAVLGDPPGSAYIFKLEGAWTPWFFDVAWDSSYAICDLRGRTWWAVFMTDTD
jgi:hypothetical protein